MAKKRSIISRILRWLIFTISSIIVLFGGFLGYMTLKDYKPKSVEEIKIEGDGKGTSLDGSTFTLITWNIGYGGLGAEQDFFFDGGKNVRPDKKLYEKYINGISRVLLGFNGVDFILLQEVDRGSKRSYFNDQVPIVSNALPDYYYGFATNYKTHFVPQPITQPYGKCYGGIMTLSRFKPDMANRFSLAQDASWPTGLFMLKRCYMEFRYKLSDGKELVVINQHLSAYDDGTVKQQQMDTLKIKLQQEFSKGNYVIVGGDWNQFPPDFNPNLSGADGVKGMNVPQDYPDKGWQWVYDPNVMTNRKLNVPFVKGKTEEVIIDYYLLSPNLTVESIQGVDLNFEFSDHQPVMIKLSLLQETNTLSSDTIVNLESDSLNIQ